MSLCPTGKPLVASGASATVLRPPTVAERSRSHRIEYGLI